VGTVVVPKFVIVVEVIVVKDVASRVVVAVLVTVEVLVTVAVPMTNYGSVIMLLPQHCTLQVRWANKPAARWWWLTM